MCLSDSARYVKQNICQIQTVDSGRYRWKIWHISNSGSDGYQKRSRWGCRERDKNHGIKVGTWKCNRAEIHGSCDTNWQHRMPLYNNHVRANGKKKKKTQYMLELSIFLRDLYVKCCISWWKLLLSTLTHIVRCSSVCVEGGGIILQPIIFPTFLTPSHPFLPP